MRFRFSATTVAILSVLCIASATAQEKKPPKITYDDHVKPLLKQKCFSCHNPDKKSGDLDLTNYTNLMQGGGSGSVIEPGDASGSYLYALITHADEPFMPPESPKLPDEMVETIRKWIDGGVLETSGSKARLSDKPKFNLALADTPTGRPKVAPMPGRLVLEPVTRTQRVTMVKSIATNPWSSVAAVASQRQILLYNTQTLDLLGVLPFPEGTPEILKFSRNGALLLAGGGQGGASGKVVVWNVSTGERVIEVGDELETVLAADISSDQRLIALGGPQRVVRIYTTEDGRLIHELRKHTDWIYSVEFSPDGVLLATGDRNGGMFVWEAYTGREYLTLKGHTKAITGVSWRSDSNILASSSEDTSIKLWEMENGGQVKSWGAHGGGALCVEFARDGRLISAGRDKVTKLWDQNGKQLLAFEAFGDLAARCSICDETNRAIAGDWNGEIRVWNAVDGKRLGILSTNPPSLAERLDTATKALAALQAKAKPLLEASRSSQDALNKAKADLAAAQQTLATAEKAGAAAKSKLDAATQKLTAITTEHKTVAEAQAKLAAAVPGIQQAAASTAEAAQKLADDKDLAATATKLKEIADKRTAELAQRKTELDAKVAQLSATKQEVATAQVESTKATAATQAAVQLVAKLGPVAKQTEEKAATSKKAADGASAELSAAQSNVSRWQSELAFVQRIRELTQKRHEAEALLAQRQADLSTLDNQQQIHKTEVDAAKTKIAALQASSVAKDKERTTLTTAMNAAKENKAKVTVARDNARQVVAKITASNAILKDAVTKAKEASGKDPGDKKLEAAVVALAQVLTDKTASAEVTTKSVAQLETQMAGIEKTIVEMTGTLTSLSTELAALQKQQTDSTTAFKDLEAKLVASSASVAKARVAIEEASKAVEQQMNELALAKSTAVKQPSGS
jgi:hypothetical protein